MVRRYARGYTEMTFSRLAVLTGAREAIIHKEFHLSSADPRLVGEDKARKIGRTNYDVADQRSEEQTSELKSLMRTTYAVLRLKTKYNNQHNDKRSQQQQ